MSDLLPVVRRPEQRAQETMKSGPIGKSAIGQRLSFERFSAEEGLSQSIVECILLDGRGFLWLGTEDGLNRFDGYEFRVFRHSTDDSASLSYSEIKCLLEDRSEALWVGTFGGLNRFDRGSETCCRFLHDPDDPATLSNDIVRALCEDRSGNLWVGTQGGGLDRLGSATGGFDHHRHDPGESGSLANDDVRVLLEDGDGRLWVGMAGGGLDCLERPWEEPARFAHYRHDPQGEHSLSHDEVTTIHQDRRGRLWIGTRHGLDRFDGGRFVNDPAGTGGLASDHVTAICDADDGLLWIGTDGGGVYLLDPECGVVCHYRHDPREPTSLSTDRVFSCNSDGSGPLWIGTYGGGLLKADSRLARFRHYRYHPDDPMSLCHGIVWSIWEDREANLWVGTDGGLDYIDRSKGEITHFLPDPDDAFALGHPGARVVYESSSGVLWVGTNGGLYRLDRETGNFDRFVHDANDATSLSHDELRSLYEDTAGILWIGTLGGGLNRFDSKKRSFEVFRHDPGDPRSLGSDFVRPIHEDRQGYLWIGLQGAGLDRFDPRTGHCLHFRHDEDDARSLSSDHVFAIWEDREGILWLGTYGGGLDRFDPNSGRVRRYGESDGLPAKLIYGLLGDDDGNLWMTSNRGLTRFEPQTETFRTWDGRDGLQDDEFNGGSYHRSRSGELFFGGINGFNAFFPRDLVESAFEPAVVLTDFQLSSRSLDPGEEVGGRVPLRRSVSQAERIRLTFRDRVFSFQFASLDFTNPGKNLYAYRMVGFDKEWRMASASHRFATYTNLAPGKYRFEVRGTNCDGAWSRRRASIRIDIEPPVWRRWWFRALVTAAGLRAATRFYRWRLRTVRLGTELGAAREAQRSIWPQADPQLPGFEIAASSLPASEVGGDFFDFVWLDQERRSLCIAVGDVAGKGMSAAMTAVLSSGMILSGVGEGRSLEESIRGINRLLFRKSSERRFTALCLARIEQDGRELRWVNAGMAEPLLKSRNRVRFLATAEPRFPLGIHEEEAYGEERVAFDPGDVVVLYTDGVPEAQDPDGEVYGYGALKHRLGMIATEGMSAKEILDALLADVWRFAGGGLQQDDMTVVVVKAETATGNMS